MLRQERAKTNVVLMQQMVAGRAAEVIRIDGRILELCEIIDDFLFRQKRL